MYKLLKEEKKYLGFLKESTGVKIPVEHPGVLEVPEGQNVEDLPIEHFRELIKKKGWSEISKSLTNLHTWNEKQNPDLAAWANKMQERLAKENNKEE